MSQLENAQRIEQQEISTKAKTLNIIHLLLRRSLRSVKFSLSLSTSNFFHYLCKEIMIQSLHALYASKIFIIILLKHTSVYFISFRLFYALLVVFHTSFGKT